MVPEYSIDVERRLVRVKFGRRLYVLDIEDYAEQLRNDPAFRPTFAEIVDLSAVCEVHLPPHRALGLADKFDPFSAEAKRAFVAVTPLQIHCARMHQLLRVSKERIAIVPSVEEAEKFLGISPAAPATTAQDEPGHPPRLGT